MHNQLATVVPLPNRLAPYSLALVFPDAQLTPFIVRPHVEMLSTLQISYVYVLQYTLKAYLHSLHVKCNLDWLATVLGAFHMHALATARTRQLLEKIRSQFINCSGRLINQSSD